MFPASPLLSLSALKSSPMECAGGHLFNLASVLFARQDSIYKQLAADVWDIDRDARYYNGPLPVVAHPPCRAWASLRHCAKPRPDEKVLALFAVDVVRRFGGVLEHPHRSTLWQAVPLPLFGFDSFGGWTLTVDQHWFGHRAQKRTKLYIVGVAPSDVPDIPLMLGDATHTVGLWSGRNRSTCRPSIGKSEYEATPPEFARWLLDLAGRCAAGFPSGSVVTPGLSLMGETN
jgi:hypothetical protein